ncbi:unnamed protein product, partial [Phaeothamnion confervicola]
MADERQQLLRQAIEDKRARIERPGLSSKAIDTQKIRKQEWLNEIITVKCLDENGVCPETGSLPKMPPTCQGRLSAGRKNQGDCVATGRPDPVPKGAVGVRGGGSGGARRVRRRSRAALPGRLRRRRPPRAPPHRKRPLRGLRGGRSLLPALRTRRGRRRDQRVQTQVEAAARREPRPRAAPGAGRLHRPVGRYRRRQQLGEAGRHRGRNSRRSLQEFQHGKGENGWTQRRLRRRKRLRSWRRSAVRQTSWQ